MNKPEIESFRKPVFIHNTYPANNQRFQAPYGKDIPPPNNCITFVQQSTQIFLP